jgi:hypothetical protein
LKSGKVSKLRPTQITVGFAEAAARQAQLSTLSSKKLDDYLKSHAIPCVLGPREHLYLTDHHHLGVALTRMGQQTCYYEIVHDLSTVPEVKFIKVMQILELLFPHGPDGQTLPYIKIPKRLCDLQDDPYRSLAGFVRGRGGYAKVPVPYSEFRWADFFRERIQIGDDFEPAIEQALELAVSAEARNLPGYVG